ncbi:MAG: hypothetical protein AAF500_13575 [Myxococcota bacterium]
MGWFGPSSAAANGPDAVGGGYADSGLSGAYFERPGFEGKPSFVRRDVRLDFRWGSGRPVGGSVAEPYRSFPVTGFSVRWTGRFIPRFSEPYRLAGEAHGGLEIRWRPSGSSAWTTAVALKANAGAFESEPIALQAGQTYDIEVSYTADGDRPGCSLGWTSPSTPQEIIDPVTQQGLNAASFVRYVWANAMKTARYGKQRDTVDARGWPTRDGTELILAEMDARDPELSGAYLLRFEGSADVRQSCCGELSFFSDGARLGRIAPKGTGYNPARNETTVTMLATGSRTMIFFDEAARDQRGSSGVTGIRFMRPLSPGSDRHHRVDEIVYRPFKRLLQDDFTAIRWLEGANNDTESTWAERARPGDAFFRQDSKQENWEYLVMLANETGKDLSITTPIAADDAYLENLALLMRYGSDGNEPYRQPTSDPKYPPLNSNLRVYVEFGNEIWNWVFPSTVRAKRLAAAEAEANTATWAAMNYDGAISEAAGIRSMRRWLALRTVAASDAFRRVWGDAAMGARVRPLLQYQYDDFQGTASSSLFFLDEYFGQPRPRALEPHPVSYYVWGGGGATYYGLANKDGTQTHTVVADASFESPAIPDGTRELAPSGSAWKFSGRAGIVRPVEPGSIRELDDLAEPIDGDQYAFLMAGGSLSQRVDFQRPGVYAIAFKAAGTGEGWPGHLPFDIYVDSTKVSPRRQSDIRPAEGAWSLGGWRRKIDNLEEAWGSTVFEVRSPGPRTIRFVGGQGEQHVLLDDIRIASVDAMIEGGFDTGKAQGQVGNPDLEYQFRSQAKYARTFGLQVVSYESGWSLGGDFHQLPIQNWTKLRDPRAKAVNDRVIELWDESGSFMSVWGVYLYFPLYDLDNATTYPIMRSFRAAAERLRAEPTYGAELPATLTTKAADWSHGYSVEADEPWWVQYLPWLDSASDAEWFSWMLIAPSTRTYQVHLRASGEGSIEVDVDGDPVLASTKVDGAIAPIPINLTKGAHAIRITTTGGVTLEPVDIK